MAISRKVFADIAEVILEGGAKKATKYFSAREVVKGTRRHKRRKGERTVEIVFTIGRPNYAEAQFIKACVKAGEHFPVKKIQLKFDKPTKKAA